MNNVDIQTKVAINDGGQCPADQYDWESETPVNDPVNNPSHYTSGKYAVIDIIEDQFGIEGLRGFCYGNAAKYLLRAGKKDPAKESEDIRKACWYLSHYATKLEKGE